MNEIKIPQLVIETFWKNTVKGETENDCWNWKGFLSKRGAPMIRNTDYIPRSNSGYFSEYSPRQLSIIFDGKEPTKYTATSCKNLLCLNPKHLLFGDEARFWDKVSKDLIHNGCWIWTAGKDKDDYGKFTQRRDSKIINLRAHIFSYQLHNNVKIPEGMQVCHTCDNPPCVRDIHLFLGTPQDNTSDMIAKGRGAKGEKQGSAKLKDVDIINIRKLFATKQYTKTDIAKMFCVAQNTIGGILLGKNWKHVE